MAFSTLELPIQLKLDERYFTAEQQQFPQITLSAHNTLESYSLFLPNQNKSGVLRNDGNGELSWSSLYFSGNQISIDYNSATNEPILTLDQTGTGDSAMYFHTSGISPTDYTIGVDVSDGNKFKISNSTELGINDVFWVSPSGGMQFTSIYMPSGTRFGTQGVIGVGASRLYNIEADRNVFYGLDAGTLTYSSAMNNVALGSLVMSNITTGSENVAIGAIAMPIASTAFDIVAIGYNNMPLLTTGHYNISIGSNNLLAITTQGYNTAIGGRNLETAISSNNTALGYLSGVNLTTGANNTFLGYQTGTDDGTYSNSSAVGAGASFNKSNKVQLGDSVNTTFLGVGSVELTTAELAQIAKINNVTISNTQWGYVGSMNQALSTTSNVTFRTIATTASTSNFGGNVHITGDLTVDGSAIYIDSIYHVEHPMLVLNTTMPPTNPGVLPPGYSGLEVFRGALPNYRVVYDEAYTTLVIGNIGDMHPVAMREDTPTNGAIPVWNAALRQFVTSTGLTASEANQLKNIDANVISNDAWKFLAKSNYPNGGTSNLGVGTGIRNTTTGYGNIYFGDNALGASNLVAINDCIAIGRSALSSINDIVGMRNIGIGYQSGLDLLNGADNVFIGYQAGLSSLLSKNICIGNLSNVAADNTQSIVIGYNAKSNGSGTTNVVVIGESANITHSTASGSIIIGRGSQIGAGGPADVSNTILLGTNLAVIPTAANQLYTIPGLATSNSGAFLIHDSTSGQIGRYTGLSFDVDGFIFTDDIWMSNNAIYLGEKLPAADYGHGLKYANTFGGVILDGCVLFGYDGGLLGTTKTADRVTLKWDDSQLATFYGNINLPYTNVAGTAGLITFGIAGARIFNPTDATSSIYIGVGAGKLGSTGANNVGLGYQSLQDCITGFGNVCVGYRTGYILSSGYYNALIGYGAGSSITTGINNTAMGYNAGTLLGVGISNNTAIGSESMQACVAGNENTAVGARSMYTSTASGNTALGFESGFLNTIGTGNTFIGYRAGYPNDTGINNLCVGANTHTGAIGIARTAIGYGAISALDNGLILGNNSVLVGIRTSSPSEALDVQGNIACSGTVDGTDISVWKADYDGKVNQDVRSGQYPDFGNLTAMTMSGFEAWAGPAPIWDIPVAGTFRLLMGGTGYIKSKRIIFTAPQTFSYTNNSANYIYINSAGTLSITSSATLTLYTDNIILFELLNDGTMVVPFVKKENHAYNFSTMISRYLHVNVGNIIQGAGAIISRIGLGGGGPTDIQVQIAGEDVVNDHGLTTNILDSGGAPITINYWYQDQVILSPTFGKWILNTTGISTPLVYNNGIAGLANLAVGEFGILRIYTTQDNTNTANPTFIGIINGGKYASQVLAESAITAGLVSGPTNEMTSMELCQLGYLVITLVSSGPDVGLIASVVVQKNSFGAQYGGGGGSSSHLLLSDLSGGVYSDGGHSDLVVGVNFAAQPGPGDDDASYKIGGVWVDSTGLRETYVCVNNLAANAVWKRIAWSNLAEVAIGPNSKSITGGVSIGSGTGSALTSGTGQVAIGFNAGNTVQSGSNGVFIGYEADGTTAGVSQMAIGASSVSVGDYSVALGDGAKAGEKCISIGRSAGLSITSATGSIYQGDLAGSRYTTGVNICIGYNAGYNDVAVVSYTGTNCAYIGANAGFYAYGNNNTLIGTNAAFVASYRCTDGIGNTGLGYNCGIGNSCDYMTVIGYTAHATGGDYNIAIGANSYVSGISSIAIGGAATEANSANTVSNYGISMGFNANCGGLNGVCIGKDSYSGTGDNCVVIGPINCSSGVISGLNNTIIGSNNCSGLTSGSTQVFGAGNITSVTINTGNCVFGYSNATILNDANANLAAYNSIFGQLCLTLATSAAYNVALGYTVGAALTTGNNNVLIGKNAAASLTTGSDCICLGTSSNIANTISNQIAIGNAAICSGADGIAIGRLSGATSGCVSIGLNANFPGSGINCTAIGHLALANNTSVRNTAVGRGCLSSCVATCDENTAVGYTCMNLVVTSNYCTAMGSSTLQSATSAHHNSAFGYNALKGDLGVNPLTGVGNCAFGSQAMICNAATPHSCSYNAAFGYAALSDLTTGANNIGIGNTAGNAITTGSTNICIGYTANCVATLSDQIAIGNGAYSTNPDALAIGRIAHASAIYSTAIGCLATASANWSIAIGSNATGPTSANATGAGSISIGNSSAASTVDSIAFGSASTSSGDGSIAFGLSTTSSNTGTIAFGRSSTASSDRGIAIGYAASASVGTYAIAIGATATSTVQSGIAIGNASVASGAAGCIAIGGGANANEDSCISIGNSPVASAVRNIAIGRIASCTVGTNSIAFGNSTVVSSTTSVAIGVSSACSGLSSISIGNAATSTGSDGIAIGRASNATADTISIGYNAGNALTQANSVVIGYNANSLNTNGLNVSIGSQNMANALTCLSCASIGAYALSYATSANDSCAFGYYALFGASGLNIITGVGNCAFGSQALYCGSAALHPCAYNSAFGYKSLYDITAGNYNVGMGYQAGNAITTGSSNICIGNDADGAATVDNQIAIGNTAACTGADGIAIGRSTSAAANEVVLGGTAATTYKYNGFNTYIVQPATLLNYATATPATPKFTIVIPTATPWHAKINLVMSENTTNIVASTCFEATGGHGTGGVGATILIGSITQCGALNAQLDTITGTNATTITVEKTANYTANPTAYKIKIYAEIHFGTISTITRTEGAVALFP